MYFTSSSETLGKNFTEAFTDLLDPTEKLKIFTKDGNVSIASRDLVRFFSPHVNSILKDVPCCTNSMIFLPDACKDSIDRVLSIISSGVTNFNVMSIKQIQEVQETAMMLGVDLTNMEYVEKSKVEIPDFAKARKEETTAALKVTEENELILQIKAERCEVNDEALLKADSVTVERPAMIKEEPLDQNVAATKPVEKMQEESPAKSHRFLAPTPPSEPELESSKPSSRSSPKHEQYLHRVRGSSRGTKRSISEETMAALAKMMKDPKRKPTMDEMEELLSRAKSFKDPVAKPSERKRDSPRSPERRSERSRRTSGSKDRRPRASERRSVSPEQRQSPYVPVPHPSPAQFQYMQAQQGLPQHGQYQGHPQLPQQGQAQPQLQYMMQQGGPMQAFVPGTVPMQYQYGAVQGMEQMQYNMVPAGSVQIQVRSPSPTHRSSPIKSSSGSDHGRYFQGVKKSDRSMAEKKASLLTMTVEEKRLMTCLDWNSGLCPRLDSGKLCVFGGSKKKHICSKIIKASKFGGSKVCWGKHREGEHRDIKERVEYRERGRREDSRDREHRR